MKRSLFRTAPLRQDEMLEGHGLHILTAHPAIAAPPDPVLGGDGLEDRDVER